MQRRLEYLNEHNYWLSDFKFGFERERLSMDCMTSVVTDVLTGFDTGKGTVALALDIKRAFNSVLPEVLISDLRELEAPMRRLGDLLSKGFNVCS